MLFKPWEPKVFFTLKSSEMAHLGLSDSFENLTYGLRPLAIFLLLQYGDRL